MATIDKISFTSFSTASYDTALCVVPSQQDCQNVDSLRALYDKSYGKWPSHINLIYPFVAPEHLSQAKSQIEAALKSRSMPQQTVTLDRADYFKHRNNSTIFLRESRDDGILSELRTESLHALRQDATSSNFHLTIGQAADETDSSREFLLSKAKLIPSFTFVPTKLVILVRERASSSGESIMRYWGSIDVFNGPSETQPMREFWLENPKHEYQDAETSSTDNENDLEPSSFSSQAQPGTTYQFDEGEDKWILSLPDSKDRPLPDSVKVSSYNVLVDSDYPPTHDRDPLLVSTILSASAIADILVLQEVSDDFLSHLLANDHIREQYPFTSHGSPFQADIGPLPSLRNIVILSKWHFNWEFLPFHRRHKGAVIATVPRSIVNGAAHGYPIVVAGVHLTCGLTDGSVAAKKTQIQHLTSHLSRKYSQFPWIIAGDFNITTSKYTIDEAVKSKSISRQTVHTLESMESTLSEAGLIDTWAVARVEGTAFETSPEAEDLHEGEEGATFNPRENALAAETSGTSRNRPQRYDRVLVRPQGHLSIRQYNDFGLPNTANGVTQVPSDHSGIRTCFRVHATLSNVSEPSDMLSQHPVEYIHAPTALSQNSDVVGVLEQHSVFPTTEAEEQRKQAFALLKKVVLGLSDTDGSSKPDISIIMVPVGSYALGVWTIESDIDCLCIGPISSKTFFRLARQRIHKAEAQGIRLLRKVEAGTGTMLELAVNGINMDLQYCPAASIVERWSEFHHLPASDPMFNMSILSLRKLKPIRDLTYIKRTLPSIASFRTAYHFIKLWASKRGIYSGKFGFLSGTHLTLMLTWVCKRLSYDNGSITAEDLIISFFHHYVNFDWQNDMVFDAFFHQKKPRYQRSLREPMVILGYHAPNSNIAHTATASGLQVIVSELKRAYERLSTAGMTWETFFESHDSPSSVVSANEFLAAHESYIKIDIQYWGSALSKGKSLIGWIESRCINLVVDIHKVLPDLTVRIWPARFSDSDTNTADNYYHGCYLIGLSRNTNGELTSNTDRTQAKLAIQKTFDRFLTQVKSDEKNYDSETSWIDISLARPDDVRDMTFDTREWGNFISEAPDSDDEDDDEDVDDSANDTSTQSSQKLPIRTYNPSTATPVSTCKLRPASDILHRLRWDPSLSSNSYIVGYEDRFLGAKETSLDRWKTEQTDDEFIPQHRILYFKKAGEGGGEVIWERKTRIDKVFGSGAGTGDES